MNLAEYLKVRPLPGEVGIEIELEGHGLPAPRAGSVWTAHEDGSLRGESREYVTRTAIKRENVKKVVSELNELLEKSGAKVDDSPRCGLHIHVNVQDLDMKQLCSFIVLYMCFEEVLVKWCGPTRLGNLFCLRVSDASGVIDVLTKFMRGNELRCLATDRIRYGSMNPSSITKHGSLEFRAMRGTTDEPTIISWVGMLLALKDYAIKHSPDELISQFSLRGPQDFFNEVLGDFREQLQPEIYDLVEGMRNAQELAFCRKWDGVVEFGQGRVQRAVVFDDVALEEDQDDD